MWAIALQAVSYPRQVQSRDQGEIKAALMFQGHVVQRRVIKQQVAENGCHQRRGVCNHNIVALCQMDTTCLLMGYAWLLILARRARLPGAPFAQDLWDEANAVSPGLKVFRQTKRQFGFAGTFSTQDGNFQFEGT